MIVVGSASSLQESPRDGGEPHKNKSYSDDDFCEFGEKHLTRGYCVIHPRWNYGSIEHTSACVIYKLERLPGYGIFIDFLAKFPWNFKE